MLGDTASIDLNQPLALTHATQFHQGDPLFIRISDFDNNLDPATRETVIVTLTVTDTSDTETIILTETGPNTGVFVGYIPSRSTSAPPFDGALLIRDGSTISARYTDRYDNTDTTASAILVDPLGLLFDTLTGKPIDGATITMIDAATGQPASVYGDDGLSSYPSSLTSGGHSPGRFRQALQFSSGGYRFPFALPGIYRLDIQPPTGYAAPSTAALASIQTLPGAPFSVVAGSRAEAFPLNPGPALRIDIPLDPSATALWVQKTQESRPWLRGIFSPTT